MTQEEKKQLANAVDATTAASSDSEEEAFVTTHAPPPPSVSTRHNCIVDSGATCHVCNDKKQFNEIKSLETSQEVTLGDGLVLNATAKGTITLEMLIPDGIIVQGSVSYKMCS